jgi:hypothetical protein
MNMRSTKHDDPEINLTPLIDVVFLLLTFFMVTTSFIHESELEINLPEATSRLVEPAETPVHISIDQKGRIAVNGQRVRKVWEKSPARAGRAWCVESGLTSTTQKPCPKSQSARFTQRLHDVSIAKTMRSTNARRPAPAR